MNCYMILVLSLVLLNAQFMMIYQINHLFMELHSVVLELKDQNSFLTACLFKFRVTKRRRTYI